MKKSLILAFCLTQSLAMAKAPVVDDSDNFSQYSGNYYDDSKAVVENSEPLAQEDEEEQVVQRNTPPKNVVKNEVRPVIQPKRQAQVQRPPQRYRFSRSTNNNKPIITEQALDKKEAKPRAYAQEQRQPNRRYQRQAPTEQSTSPSEEMQLLLAKLNDMQREMADLRGKLEVQSHQLSALKSKPRKKRYAAIKKRQSYYKKIKRNTPAKREMAPQKNAAKNNTMDEQLSYVGAFELVKNKHFDKAIPAMKQFLDNYPKGPYAANAHYWLGELYLLKQDYNDAIDEFNIIIDKFKDSSKLAAAKLKLGVTYARLGDKFNAKQQFKAVTEEFPDTSAARLAKAKLAQI